MTVVLELAGDMRATDAVTIQASQVVNNCVSLVSMSLPTPDTLTKERDSTEATTVSLNDLSFTPATVTLACRELTYTISETTSSGDTLFAQIGATASFEDSLVA